MATFYTTRGFSGDCSSLWRNIIHDVYANLEIDFARNPKFSGELRRLALGRVEVTEVKADSEIAQRTQRHIHRGVTGSYIYLLVKSGELDVRQFGRNCCIQAGQYALLDLDEPYEFSHVTRVHKFGVKLPRSFLQRSPGDLAQFCAISRPAQSGIAKLAADYVCGLTEQDVEGAADDVFLLSRTVSDLLYLSLDTKWHAPSEMPAVKAAMRRRAVEYIERYYIDAGLRPEGIARGLNVSPRYLHQCFEGADLTVMQQIKQTRLQRAYSDLEDVSRRREPINQIALRNGFSNTSHFNEAFKQRFGVTPRQLRVDRAD